MTLARRLTTPKKFVLGFAALAALLFGVQTVATAGGGASHPRAAETSAELTGQGFGGGCGMGYDTQSNTNVPPDDSTSDNPPAATATFRKTCPGIVVGRFVSETATSTAGDFIHIDMRATCVGSGGLTDPCTVGAQIFGSPGHTFMQNAQSGNQTHSVTMIWTGLKRGNWKFEVLPGGNNSASLQFRSFTAEGFAG